MQAVAIEHIAVDPEIRGGRPHLAGTRLSVADVLLMHLRLGQTLEEIAGKYNVLLASLHEAMAFYYDHRDEVDRSIEDDEAFEGSFRQQNSSLLQAKLAMKHRA